MRVHWCRTCGAGGQNFGDAIGPRLLEHFGHAVEWSPAPEAELVTAGSVLSKLPDGWRGTVLGAGFIRAGLRKDLRRARILALRGRLTAATVRGGLGVRLGDPGILAPLLFPPSEAPRSGVVIVPHYVDRDLALRYPEARVARIDGDPQELVDAITSAERVVASSLHGLITADAYGIPHSVEPHPKVTGGLFKFEDYASAFIETIRPGVVRLTPPHVMAERQASLAELFRVL